MHSLNNLSGFIDTINLSKQKTKFDDECNKDHQFDCQMRARRCVGLTREGYKSAALSHERNERYRIGAVIFAKAASTSLTLAIIFSKNLSRIILQYARKLAYFPGDRLTYSYLTNFMAQGKNSVCSCLRLSMQNIATKTVVALVYLM